MYLHKTKTHKVLKCTAVHVRAQYAGQNEDENRAAEQADGVFWAFTELVMHKAQTSFPPQFVCTGSFCSFHVVLNEVFDFQYRRGCPVCVTVYTTRY